jgi:hypothetical protein
MAVCCPVKTEIELAYNARLAEAFSSIAAASCCSVAAQARIAARTPAFQAVPKVASTTSAVITALNTGGRLF